MLTPVNSWLKVWVSFNDGVKYEKYVKFDCQEHHDEVYGVYGVYGVNGFNGYLTAGKVYPVKENGIWGDSSDYSCGIIDDAGDDICVMVNSPCLHLGEKSSFCYCDKYGNKL